MVFLRIIESPDKAVALAEAIADPSSPLRFEVDPGSFATIPGSPFAYWASESIRAAFATFPRLEADGRTAKQGLATADDFRFLRLWTETSPEKTGHRWFPFAKGGKFSPFFADFHLVVNWARECAELAAWKKAVLRNIGFFFRPGLTWTRVTSGRFSLRPLPAGCIFGDAGPAMFVAGDDPYELLALLAVVNSRPFRALVDIQTSMSFEVGTLQRTPVPDLEASDNARLIELSRRGWSLKRRLDMSTETSHVFTLPALLRVEGANLAKRSEAWAGLVASIDSGIASIQDEIDDICFRVYGLDATDCSQAEAMRGGAETTSGPGEAEGCDGSGDEDGEGESMELDTKQLVASLLSWAVGVALGRFDPRLATGERQPPGEPEPFERLPVCSPAMLVDESGLPVKHPSPGDPIQFPADGILVDDHGHDGGQPHRDDIVRRVREVFDLLWKDESHEIEREACNLLGVANLRDYFRSRAKDGFFPDHLKRYSMSRRNAPIYWPLSTASGSYTIWLYYHRLTSQTIYGAINKLLDPKIAEMERRIAGLEGELKSAPERGGAKLLDRLNAARSFRSELQDLKDELLRIANRPYTPDLNDGVIINAAPFHQLFRHGDWTKISSDCWKKLEKGRYDWAHLAFAIWPDRVREACRTNRTWAIAHGLEILCESEPPKKNGRRGRRKGGTGI
jgi:hypothetical protein